jgi:hypothetical protein
MAHLNSSIVVGGDEFEPTSTARESYQAYPYLQTGKCSYGASPLI